MGFFLNYSVLCYYLNCLLSMPLGTFSLGLYDRGIERGLRIIRSYWALDLINLLLISVIFQELRIGVSLSPYFLSLNFINFNIVMIDKLSSLLPVLYYDTSLLLLHPLRRQKLFFKFLNIYWNS
jgi:hypothetical protein